MSKKIKALGMLLISISILSGCVSNRETLVNSQEIPVDQIEKIDIRYQSDSINFYQSETDELRLEEYLIPNKGNTKAEVTTSGNELSIKGGKRKESWFVLNNESRIDIYLPKNYQRKLAVEVTSGDVTGESLLKLTDFSVKASSGNFAFKNIDAEKIELAISSGEIYVERLYADDTIVETTSGNIELGKVLSKHLQGKGSSGQIEIEQFRGDGIFNLTSGDLSLEDVQGSAAMEISSGEISADFSKVTGDIKVKTTSGNVDLAIPKNLAFNFDSQVTSGDITTYFSKDLEKEGKKSNGRIGKKPKIAISVEVSSGTVEIDGK